MIVPDFTTLSGPHPGSVYHGIMMSMMEQGNNYGAFMGRSPPHPVRSSPQMSRSPPQMLCSKPNLLGLDAVLGRPDFRIGKAVTLQVSASTTSHITTKTDVVVSPISSEGGSGLSPSSERSHAFMSSEDGEGGSTESCPRDDEESGDKKAFKCPQCLYFTDRKNNLKRHIITMHQECSKTLECCGVVFHSKAALRDHVGLFHRGGYRCQICSRNFCRKALLRRHLTVHSGRKDFSCQLCGYATSHKSNLERHQKVHLRRPVCPASRPHHDLLPAQVSEERKVMSRHHHKFGYNKDRMFSRFILLPNRLKHTHNIDHETDRKGFQSLSPLNDQGIEKSAECQKVSHQINCENRLQPTEKSESRLQLSGGSPKHSDIENIHTDFRKFSKMTSKKCSGSGKHSLLSSKRRIFTTPYKCSDCFLSFSNQTDLHGHVCRTLRQSHDPGLSVITAVRKGKVRLLPQKDLDTYNQMSSSEMCEKQ